MSQADDAVRKHFVAVSTNAKEVAAFFAAAGSPDASTYSPGAPHPYMQKTRTLDLCLVLEGEITLTTEGGDQVLRAETKIISVTGADSWFRFPFGDRNAHTISVVNSVGFVPVGWTVDTLGWKGTSGGITVQTVVNRVRANLRPGEIVLMHSGSGGVKPSSAFFCEPRILNAR